jgi:hypothetical protein
MLVEYAPDKARMHFHLPFSTGDILWTLTFAGYLVLLVVLMGRDRIRRFPWFTASIVIMALRILTIRLLVRRLPELTLDTIILVMADVLGFVVLLVVVELARRAFGGVSRSAWVAGALALMVLGGVVLKFWGPWPAWSTLTANSTMSTLRLLQLIAQKATLVADVETIAVGFLIVLLGSRFKAGWRSHTQQIAIGLSTASISALLVEGIWQNVLKTAQANPAILQSAAEQQRVLALGPKLSNTNSTVYIAILIWWIVCLWRDEPGTNAAAKEPSEDAQRAVIEAGNDDAVTPARDVE